MVLDIQHKKKSSSPLMPSREHETKKKYAVCLSDKAPFTVQVLLESLGCRAFIMSMMFCMDDVAPNSSAMAKSRMKRQGWVSLRFPSYVECMPWRMAMSAGNNECPRVIHEGLQPVQV